MFFIPIRERGASCDGRRNVRRGATRGLVHNLHIENVPPEYVGLRRCVEVAGPTRLVHGAHAVPPERTVSALGGMWHVLRG